jgi:hypothetical protein
LIRGSLAFPPCSAERAQPARPDGSRWRKPLDFMNYRDAELLNGSINHLGETLLHSRMLEQQKQAREEDRSDTNNFRTKQIDLEQQRLDATNRNVSELSAERQKTSGQRVWKDTVDMFGGWVKDGIMPPDVAQNSLRQAYEKMPDAQKQFIADHPATQAILNDEPIWEKPNKPAPALTPSKIGKRDLMIGPGGSVHYTDEFAPADKLEVEDLNDRLREIDRRTRELAKTPDPAEARALLAQQKVLTTRKNSILEKYKTQGAGATQPDEDSQTDSAALIQQAKDAIARGADPEKVKARLKQKYGLDLK